jgi:succinoglycan biosynthesis protein ExoU
MYENKVKADEVRLHGRAGETPAVAQPSACVAVLIPAMNASATIGRAVRSALAEPETAEVVVVDDGSTDDTAEVAAACDDGTARLKIIRQANAGPSAATNVAIEASTAPYLCNLDADDFFVPGRFRTIFEQAGTDWDLAADKLLLGREGAEDGPYERWRGDAPLPPVLTLADFVDGNISRASRPRTELGYMQPLKRRAFLDEHGLRFREDLWLGEDYLMYAECVARGGVFKTVEHHGYIAIQRPTSLSHQHPPEHLEALMNADKALAAIPGIPPPGRRALARHQASIKHKWVYRRVLAAKKEGRVAQAIGLATLSGLDVFFYVAAETLRARRADWAARRTAARQANWTPAHASVDEAST